MGLSAEKIEERLQYLGGTDAAAVVGLSRRKTLLECWAEKTGAVPRKDISDVLQVKLGNMVEPVIAELFMEESGKTVHRVNETITHPVYPFIAGNIDRRIVGERAGVELKMTSAYMEKEWKGEEIPQEYILQCLHYLAITGWDRWYLAVLIGNHDFKWMVIERNEEAIENLIRREVEFWTKYVIPGVMPQMVKAKDSEVLFKLFPEAPDGSQMSLQRSTNDLITFIQTLQSDKTNLEAQIEGKKNELKLMLGHVEVGLTDIFKVSWKNQITKRLDIEELQKRKPEVYQQFLKASPTRVLRITERKGV